MNSTREQILGVQDLKSETTCVPEWGVTIELRELSGTGRKKFFKLITPAEGEKVDLVRYYAAAAALGAHEPGGGPILAQDDAGIEEDIRGLMAKRFPVVKALGEKVLELSGIGQQAEEAAEKNSGSDAPSV